MHAPDAPPATAWPDDLDEQQRAAVTHDAGHLLVVAGAGSGKTRTLAARVAHLVAGGIRPERVLLLTFTRRAAADMRARAGTLLGRLDPDAARATGEVTGGTFHAIACRLLRRYGTAVGLPAGFTVLDEGDATDLFGLVRTELGLAERGTRFPRAGTVAAIYTRMVNSQRPLSEVVHRHFPWCRDHLDALREVFEGYQARKRRSAVVDYDDLLLYWRALSTSPLAGPARDLYDHVLVDEYQDTNTIQADILAALAEGGATVTAVGDDAQAIYGFRAATVANLEQFADRFPGTTVVSLDRNYRSTPQILAAANAVMQPAPRRYPRDLHATRPDGQRPVLATCADEAAQSADVCERVLWHRERGVDLREQAVLFRAAHLSDHLEVELARRDIPFVKYGGLRFLEAAHVKDVLALLRVLDNPRDVLAWTRTLGSLEGVGPATIRRLLTSLGLDAEAASDAADGALHRLLTESLPVPAAARAGLDALRAALADCLDAPSGAAATQPPPEAQLDRLRQLCELTFPARYRDPAARLADVDALGRLAAEYASRARFLAELTLDPPTSTSDLAGPPHQDDDWLVLSTIHSAKGGEWRVVHVVHAADGNLPSDMALSDREGLEEERRLVYVAATRARDALTVAYPLRYHHRRHGHEDAHSFAQLSRFLEPARPAFDAEGVGGAADDEPAASPATLDPVPDLLSGLWSA